MGFSKCNAPAREELFWVFCRVLAEETRLRLLLEVSRCEHLSVAELAQQVGIGDVSASIHLKMLHGSGMVVPYRKKQQVFYSVEAPETARFASLLLPNLIRTFQSGVSPSSIIHLLTAFTHQRRIEVLRSLSHGSKTSEELLKTTGMTSSALSRHLIKLRSRDFVVRQGTLYCMGCPDSLLARTLLEICLS